MTIAKSTFTRLIQSKKKFVPKKKSKHELSVKKDYLAHVLDDDVLRRCRGKFVHDGGICVLDIFDPNLDAQCGVYYFLWDEASCQDFWYGLIIEFLKFLRKANLHLEKDCQTEALNALEVLDFFCSQQFDEICGYEGLDANIVRCAIPRIIRKYNRKSSGYCQYLLNGLTRLSNWYFEQPNNSAEQINAWSY